MASTEISIKQLPTISSIEAGNSLIIQTDNATNKLDFKDFVVGLENTTFSNTISSSKAITDIFYDAPATNSAASFNAAAIKGLPITIGNDTYHILLSATN